jgi:hypothetical protein
MTQHAEPLDLGPVLHLGTSGPVGLASAVEWCRARAWAIHNQQPRLADRNDHGVCAAPNRRFG